MRNRAIVSSLHAAALLALVLATPTSQAHRVPDVWMTGQRLIDLFDPAIKPKMLYSEDGTFVVKLPAKGWATDAERLQHIRGIDAENGRAYIKAVFDGARGRSFCFGENNRPNDETFFEDVIRELRAVPRERLQRQSAFELIVEIWSKKLPCPVDELGQR